MASAAAAPLSSLDEPRLAEALQLAVQAIGLSDPNPRVGCLIAGPDGRVLGRGSTQAAGEAHAEIMALRDATSAGHDVRGATAWVTLEPCSHHGRTPPCCDALIAAGIARVVVALADPFPEVDGRGIARLRAAGVDVDVADPASDIALAARELNIGFFSRVRRGRPWVRMKIAASLDGRTALLNGRSQWITGAPARADGHAWRKRASATLTGIGTVLEDDPRLDVREVPTARQPQRVIVDSRLQTPPAARILQPPGRVWIYAGAAAPPQGETGSAARGERISGQITADADVEQGRGDSGHNPPSDGAAAMAARRAALEAAGADIRVVAEAAGSGSGAAKVDLAAMLADLASRGVNELHVEAGHKLNASLLRAGLVDELLVYLAPKLIGLGREMAAFGPITELAQALPWRFIEAVPVGDDLRIRARPPGRENF